MDSHDIDQEMDHISRDLGKIEDATAMIVERQRSGKSTNEKNVRDANKLITQIRIRLNSLELEVQESQSYNDPRSFQRQRQALKELKRNFKDVKGDYEDARSGVYRGDLGLANQVVQVGKKGANKIGIGQEGARRWDGGGDMQEQNERFGKMDLKTAGNEGDRIQNDTKLAANRANQGIIDAETVGERALTRLQEYEFNLISKLQGEQIDELDGKLDAVDENIEINRALLIEVAKASLKDKIVQLLCGIFTLVIIAMIIVISIM